MYNTEHIKAYFDVNNVLLAPMAGVTDRCFRALCREQGAGLTYTEMVSAKGLYYNKEQGNSYQLLQLDEKDKPVVVQMFGNHASILAEEAKKICDSMQDDIAWIDINMGCPAPKITKNGEGSALMKNLSLASDIIQAVNKAIPVPLTVKFRLGWDDTHCNTLEFAKMAEESGASAVCVHGRTRMQFYSGLANWDTIKEIKNELSIPVIGNGDIFSAEDAQQRLNESGVDAIMVARGAQGNPWIFAQIKHFLDTGEQLPLPTPEEKIDMALRHAQGLIAFRGEHAIVEMRKHVAWYLSGIHGAAKIRLKVNECVTLDQLRETLYDALPVS